MKKIVFVDPILSPYSKLRYQELAKNLEIETHVIVEKDSSKNRFGWKFSQINGCIMHLLKSIDYKSHRIAFRLRHEVNSIKPDMVIVHNSVEIALLFLLRKYKIGVIVEDTIRAAEKRGTFNKVIKRFLLNRVDFYIPFSRDAVEFLKENKINRNMHLSSWSVDLNYFRDLTDNKKIESEKKYLHINCNTKNFILVASLIPRKGIKPFISAWKKMSYEFKQKSSLYILGDGPLKEELEEYTVSDKEIIFCGNQDYHTVSHYLQCGDIFVLPTLEDLCSLSVFEAMAAGLPVLTTIYNGARELVVEGENGYIFDSEKEESIIEVLHKIDCADLEQMAEKSKQIIDNYSNEKVMKKFANKLLNIM